MFLPPRAWNGDVDVLGVVVYCTSINLAVRLMRLQCRVLVEMELLAPGQTPWKMLCWAEVRPASGLSSAPVPLLTQKCARYCMWWDISLFSWSHWETERNILKCSYNFTFLLSIYSYQFPAHLLHPMSKSFLASQTPLQPPPLLSTLLLLTFLCGSFSAWSICPLLPIFTIPQDQLFHVQLFCQCILPFLHPLNRSLPPPTSNTISISSAAREVCCNWAFKISLKIKICHKAQTRALASYRGVSGAWALRLNWMSRLRSSSC